MTNLPEPPNDPTLSVKLRDRIWHEAQDSEFDTGFNLAKYMPIALVGQHEESNMQKVHNATSEISVVEENALEACIHAILRENHVFGNTVTVCEGMALKKIMNAIRPRLCTTEPVSVDLEKCARALADGDHKDYLNRFDMASYRRYAANVLDAAGVKYVG